MFRNVYAMAINSDRNDFTLSNQFCALSPVTFLAFSCCDAPLVSDFLMSQFASGFRFPDVSVFSLGYYPQILG